MALGRREFVKGALGASGIVLLGSKLAQSPATPMELERSSVPDVVLPEPGHSGIEHVVLVMMENRSFDHLLGWLPGADGRQAGLTYVGPSGKSHKTYHQHQLDGCGFVDPDHSYSGGRIQYNNGRMDGFLTDTANDSFAISYYTAADRPFMSNLARQYTTCDRYFCSILGPTFSNRVFQHAAQTDRLADTFEVSTLPTIWDRLNQFGGPTGHYYYSDFPILSLWGPKYNSISSKITQFKEDAAAGALPNVSFVDPGFGGESNGTSDDDHPLADLRAGDAFLSQIFHAVASGPGWAKTVLVINYDEWGGFFDHVPARRVTAGVPIGANPNTGVDRDLDANNKVLTGFRVPCIIASPFTRVDKGSATTSGRMKRVPITHNLYDHTSVLKLIEWRWGLEPLTQRDASKAPTDPGNLATALDFTAPDPTVPGLPVLSTFVPAACPAPTSTSTTATGQPAATTTAAGRAEVVQTEATVQAPADREPWAGLRQSGLLDGWS